MTNYRRGGAAPQDEQREQLRLALGAMLIPLFFVIMFAVCIIGTYHKPHPNAIKVGVVGPAAQTAPLRATLEKATGSAFDNAERSLLYFGGLGIGTDLLRLVAWTGVIIALLLLPVSRKLEHQPEHLIVAEHSAVAEPVRQ